MMHRSWIFLSSGRGPARCILFLLVWTLVAAACSDSAGTTGPSPSDIQVDTDETTTTGVPTTTTTPTTILPRNPDDPSTDSIAGVEIALTPVAEIESPIAFASRSGDEAIYVAGRAGRVWRLRYVRDDDSGEIVAIRPDSQPALDISETVSTQGEGGLLGITFSRDGRHLFVSYTDSDFTSRIDEYDMGSTRATADSRREILTLDQPFLNHNGGDIHFGPDGFLYASYGDGGQADDPLETGQDPTDLLGSMLRVDPELDDAGAYGIPDGNPFDPAGDPAGAAEVWLYGLRNPWRFSFDSHNGDLWIADVGQNEVEEITLLPADGGGGRGANLGWSLMEGDQESAGPAPADHTGPLLTYTHDDGRCSITGGYVYRGQAIPEMNGAYVYGDWCTGEIRAVLQRGGIVLEDRSLDIEVPSGDLVSFGTGPHNEIWVAAINEGVVYRIDLAPEEPDPEG
ncbi:MAG: PQQ-dependent sugar dehydrogenase [Actinomycetia bacterium]|nr:PQQ-dependent sugar dehydrogenase [Actinomycetes bacterium]